MNKGAIIFLILLFPILIFATSDFGTRLLVYPSTFSVDLSVLVNGKVALKSEIYIIWWLKVGFKLTYPKSVNDIFIMSDFSNDLAYATFLPSKKVYVKSLGDSYSTLDFFKKYVIQIIRNYYIYGHASEEIPITNAGYFVHVNKDLSLKDIVFKVASQTLTFSFTNWDFNISEVMSKVYSFIDKNKIRM